MKESWKLGFNMTKNQYDAWTKPYRENMKLTQIILLGNKILTYICYVLFPILIGVLYFTKNILWLRCLLTAGISFVFVSVFRKIYNKKRPYEKLSIEPLIKKDTKGKSFPSRHVFSVFVIAICWFCYCPVIGVILLVIGVLMAYIRVIGGVHYPIDVLAGAIIGILSGLIGIYFI